MNLSRVNALSLVRCAFLVIILVISCSVSVPAAQASYYSAQISGGSYNGPEQTNEANAISAGMSAAGGNGGVKGLSQYRNSYYEFDATNGVYFALDGVDIGSVIGIVHRQDFVGIAQGSACTASMLTTWNIDCDSDGNNCSSVPVVNSDDSSCRPYYVATWGRSNRTLTVEKAVATCGSANGSSFASAPTANLCSSGTASAVYDYGYWSWSCNGGHGITTTCSATKTVPAPTLTFYADNTSVAYNAGTNLHWSSTNATSCSASGNWSAAQPTSGSAATGSLTSSPTYYLTCTGPGGSIMNTVTVNVAALPTVQIQFN